MLSACNPSRSPGSRSRIYVLRGIGHDTAANPNPNPRHHQGVQGESTRSDMDLHSGAADSPVLSASRCLVSNGFGVV